jgi:cholesterol transport system auxiliary component
MTMLIHSRPRRAVLLALGATGLAGCTGLATLQAVTEPFDLYDLTPKSTYPADLPEITAQLVIEEPTAASAVDTDRIAVRPNPYQIEYFPRSRWVDRAPILVQTMLLESFENTGKVASVGRQMIGLSANYTLLTELREFQAEVGEGEGKPLTVLVYLNMKIVKQPEGLIIASRSFGERLPSASDKVMDVVAAFDTALGKTMGQAVDWTVRQIAERRS